MSKIINIDSDLDNADWTKRTWDLLDIDTVEKLREHLKATGRTVEQFKQLPVYRYNVDKIEWLKKL